MSRYYLLVRINQRILRTSKIRETHLPGSLETRFGCEWQPILAWSPWNFLVELSLQQPWQHWKNLTPCPSSYPLMSSSIASISSWYSCPLPTCPKKNKNRNNENTGNKRKTETRSSGYKFWLTWLVVLVWSFFRVIRDFSHFPEAPIWVKITWKRICV